MYISVGVKFVIILLYLELSNAILLELAKWIPNFTIEPFVLYEVGGKKYSPTTVNIIRANGYPVETHLVHTEDGYILEMHRIPFGIKSGQNVNKFPVILQHGNFQSSADWVLNSPANLSLGFLLADNGYDVWLGNQRGNSYSNSHERYPLSSNKFWNFSLSEVGYDVDAVVNYITQYTGHPKVHFISFSLGTTAFYAGLSLRPELSSKIGLGVTMGPSVFQNNFFNGFAKLIAFTSKFTEIFQGAVGTVPILPHFLASIIHTTLPIFCNPKVDFLGVCINFMHLFFGHDGNLIKKEQLPLITSVAPSPTGLKTWNHIVQLIGSSRFAEYDYGKKKNLVTYGRSTPPDYNLTNVQAPIAILVGPYDFLAHREDAKLLAEKLPNLIEFYSVPYEKFTHLDFTYGRDVAYGVYKHIIELLDRFNAV